MNRTISRRLATWVLLSLAWSATFVAPASAQEHRFHDRAFSEHEFRERAYFDHRFGHDHYYPPHGWAFGALPPHHHAIFFGGIQFYCGDGIWYRFEGPSRYVVVAPPIGIVVPVLPPFYATVWAGGVPYYYANNVYYVRTPYGYEVVAPPPPNIIVEQPPAPAPPPPPSTPVPPAAQNSAQVYAYPNRGQSEEQSARDRYECHRWAVSQSGYDPSVATSGAAGVADYRRAITACLEGRGYTVK